MVRRRVRKTDRGTTHIEVYQQAADEHFENKISVRAAAKKYNVCHVTLNRYIKRLKTGNTTAVIGYRPVNRVFNDEEEEAIRDYVLLCSNANFGLTHREVRKLAYELACKFSKRCPPKWHVDQLAGTEWLTGFLKRHTTLSLKRQSISQSREVSLNQDDISRFFDSLAEAMANYKFIPKDIDETNIPAM